MNQTTFPCYRKLRNDKSFYKISGERTFTEIQCVGNQYFKIEIIANKYHEIINIFVRQDLRLLGSNKTGFNLLFFHFHNRGKQSILRCNK